MKKIVWAAAITTALTAPLLAQAESTFNNAASSGSSATARLNLAIVIPQVLFLRVGTSSGNGATDSTIDNLTFTIPVDKVGDGTPVAAVGGDLGAGAVTVRVYGNGGDIKLTSSTTGAMLGNSVGDSIPWSQIKVDSSTLATATAGYSNQAINHPTLGSSSAGGTSAAPTTLFAVNKIVQVEGKWTYSYLNTTSAPAGSYGGTSAKNGQVTYTATQL